MSRNNHPVEQEELMAYLDGELETDRAVEAAAHLEHCAECQEFAAELREISAELMAWEVEAPGSIEMPDEIVAALKEKNKSPKKKVTVQQGWRGLLVTPRLAWTSGIAACLLIAIFLGSQRNGPSKQFDRLQTFAQLSQAPAAPSAPITQHSLPADKNLNDFAWRAPGVVGDKVSSQSIPRQQAEDENGNLSVDGQPAADVDVTKSSSSSAPMIARSADLILNTKEFDKVRASLEEILKRHNGYMGGLNVTAPRDGGRTLATTLRIPAPQLDAALAELKQLGRVEKEGQSGEEVTQQYVDLEARLANSQHTEQRLTQILQQRTGKLQDVLKVELEIDRVRGEIEQMQAEKKELGKRVAFATLNMTVQEEYQAKLQSAPPSTASKFRNAAVDGYNTVVEGFIDVGLFALSAGPSLLIWIAILFFPARWAWRKWKKGSLRQNHEETEGNTK